MTKITNLFKIWRLFAEKDVGLKAALNCAEPDPKQKIAGRSPSAAAFLCRIQKKKRRLLRISFVLAFFPAISFLFFISFSRY
jgi:hypothetical protein